MPLTDSQAAVTILVMAAATLLTRVLPFVVFSSRNRTPAFVVYLGEVLPYAVIGLLIVYCFKDVKPLAPPYGLPETVAAAATAALFLWRRNVMLAIAGGTLLYIFLVQYVAVRVFPA